MKSFIIALVSLLAGQLAAIGGDVTRYELNFGEFNELKVVDGINVDYQCCPEKAGKVEFYASADVASAVIFEPSAGKLAIKIASRDTVFRNLPKVTVYSTYLTRVSNEGDSVVRVLSMAPGPKLSARLIGNGRLVVRDVKLTQADVSILSGKGTIVIYGEVDEAKFTVAGSGQIQADELKTSQARCSVTGTGNVSCYAVKRLNVSGLGSGRVYYRGAPEVKKGFLNTVKVISLDNEESK